MSHAARDPILAALADGPLRRLKVDNHVDPPDLLGDQLPARSRRRGLGRGWH